MQNKLMMINMMKFVIYDKKKFPLQILLTSFGNNFVTYLCSPLTQCQLGCTGELHLT